ncbi:MAG: tetratricopeptide repeat protein [Phycisphaerae bacterium]|nr:tetratricopeptide repeat protein [Phycisphaerae bacterium]NUQ47881.1 tetratricopeptide repeat protein [Phycisphaerae bacterium]
MSARSVTQYWQAAAGATLAVVVVLLLGNSLFLYTVDAPDAILAFMIEAHVWLGYALCAAIALFAGPHYLLHRRHANLRARRLGYTLITLIVVGCIAGVRLHVVGHSLAVAWLARLHEIAFVLALLAYMFHRLVARATPVLHLEFAGAAAAIVVFLVVWNVHRPEPLRSRLAAPDPRPAPAALVADFGASRAATTTGHWLREDDLSNPGYCAQCHVEIAEQWDGSAHHFSSLNDPFYEKTFESLQRARPPAAAKFCGGCHDPLVFLTGHMEQTVTGRTINAQEGITCLACHAITEVRDRVGNGGYVLAAPDHYPFYDSKDPEEQEMNRRLIRSKPEKHKAAFLKPFHRTSEFCLACHKANLDVVVNHYRWKRGQNDYDPWHDSAAGMKSALTFYNAEKQKLCQDCHMPDVPTQDPAARDGLSRDHSFASANTALAMIKDKNDWLRKAQELLKDCVSTDIFSAVVDPGGPDARRIWPLEHPDARVPAGTLLRVEVLARNRNVGHLFPGGTIDLNEAWMEFTVARENHPPMLASGLLDRYGRLDPSAHRFNVVMLTREGRFVDIHNVEDFYTILYNNALPLGPADVIRYEFVVPELSEGARLRLTARLNYRKFSRQYTEFALGPDAPPMPVTLVSEDTVDLVIGRNTVVPSPAAGTDLAVRVNDFGIAHLRQGDTRTARWAFRLVAEMNPADADAWVNLARCSVVDGAYDVEMEKNLRQADAVRPGYHKTAYFLGRLRAAQGLFDEAVKAYDVTLSKFPEDREALNQKGTALFKQEKFREAVGVFEQVLRIDPENVTAHSYLFRAHAALGESELAAKYEAQYLRFQPQEAEKAVTEIYRRNNPDADREANAQHVHPLSPPGEAGRDRALVWLEAMP